MTKLNIGSGRQLLPGYINIDVTQYVDGNGRKLVNHVLNIEVEKLPFEDNSIDEVLIDNVLEHLGDGFIFAMNEMHRVVKSDGFIHGNVPVAGTRVDFMDITHKRHFIKDSFNYLCGNNLAMNNRPSHPRYADYGVLPWVQKMLSQENDLIYFELSPNK